MPGPLKFSIQERHSKHDMLKLVGGQFGIEKYIKVSSIVEGEKSKMKADKGLKTRLQNLAEGIANRQKQT